MTLLPQRYQNHPSDFSMDYRMNPDNFWVVWVKSPEQNLLEQDFLKQDFFKIVHGFVLADPQEGYQDIEKAEHGQLLCALSLSQFRLMMQTLHQTKPSFTSQLPSWLGGTQTYMIVEHKDNQIETTLSQAGSEEECFTQALTHHPHAQILWVAPVSPLIQLHEEMEDIFNHEDYTRIFFDRRPISPGHPEDWFEYMQRPHAYAQVKQAQAYFKEHPERLASIQKTFLEESKP